MGNIRHSFNTSNQETTFSQMPYRLLYSSYSKYEQDWESYPHTHYFSELFYVLNGCGSFIVEEESFPIRKQNLIIINPSIRHTEVSDKNSPLEYIVLGVEGLNFLIYKYTVRRFLRKSRLLLSYDPPGDGRTKRKLRDDLSKSSRSSHHSTFTTYRIARRNASFLKKDYPRMQLRKALHRF